MIMAVSFFTLTMLITVPVQAEETPFTVDFSANVTNGTAPLPVHFENLATGNQVSGFWVINNETFEQLTGPDYTFIQSGNYTISLTVTDDTNTTLTETKTDYIVVSPGILTTTLSFIAMDMWGLNPIEITDLSNGSVILVGNTSSRNVILDSSGHYSIKIEAGGITDTLNSPDYGIVQFGGWGAKNLLGIIIGVAAVIAILGLIFYRRK